MDKIKNFLPSPEKCPNISFNMRLASYLICLIVGFITITLSITKLFIYKVPHYRSFALWYTLSNIIWLISIFILIGPREHYRKMISDELLIKSIALTFSIFISLLFGFLTSSKIVNLFFSLLQFLSIIVFTYSYLIKSNNKNIENLDYSLQNNNLNN